MSPELIAAVLHRGGYRCAWCACKLGIEGVVCRLDVLDDDSSRVASCRECAGEYARLWRFDTVYSVENAKRILGRDRFMGWSQFVDYLERATRGSGLSTPFQTALARIEAQRNAPLDVRRERAA